MANVFQSISDKFKGLGKLAGALGDSARAKKQADEVQRKLEEKKRETPILSGNIFKDVATNLSPAPIQVPVKKIQQEPVIVPKTPPKVGNISKDVAERTIAGSPLTKLIAGVPLERVVRNPEREVQIGTERAQKVRELQAQGKTREEAVRLARIVPTKTQQEELMNLALGTIGPAGEIRGAKVAKEGTKKLVKEEAKAIPPELEPLAAEARKYKSAEEFVKVQGIPVFRGGTATDLTRGKSLGISVSTERSIAEDFAKKTKAGGTNAQVDEFIIKPNIKILDASTLTQPIVEKATGYPILGEVSIMDYAKKNGYDAVDFSKRSTYFNTPEAEIKIINNDVLQTKSQLTDFYNKAVGANARPPTIPKMEAVQGGTVARPEPTTPQVETLPREVSESTNRSSRAFEKVYHESGGGARDSLAVETSLSPTIAGEAPQRVGLFNSFKEKVGNAWLATRERGFISSIKEQLPEAGKEAERIGGQYIPRDTDQLAIKAKNFVKDNTFQAEEFVKANADDKAVAVASELIKHYNEAGNFEKAGQIAHDIAAKLTEQGRSVQAASILGRLTPEGQLRFAASEINRYNAEIAAKRGGVFGLQKKIPNLTLEQTSFITTEAKLIEKMPDGIEKAMRFKKLNDYIANLVPSPLYQKLITLWKAGLLTGVKTSGLNTFSNLFHGASEILKDIPAVAVDKVSSLFTGKKTIGFTTRGTAGGVGEGFQKGLRYFKTGFDERNIAQKLDWKQVNFGDSKFAKGIQTYEETVFRILGAEDQPFYYGAKARSLFSQALADAKNKRLKGTGLEKFVQEAVKNPTDEMLRYATIDAETAVFQNKTKLGDIAKKIQQTPGGEIIVPFGRTPSAVATQIINYSPVGIVKSIVENIGKGRFDQRLFSQGVGRGLVGTAGLYVGYKLFENGLLTLGRPTGEKEQKLWEIEGRSANSIKVGGKWRTVQTLGPIGPVLLIGGYFKQAFDETGSPTEAFVNALAGGAKSFTEQTFLRGINQAVTSLTDPERSFQTFATSMAGSTVPTLVADLARATDYVERRNRGPLERIKSRIPFLRQTLEPQITVLGSEVPRYGGNPLESMVDPTRPSVIQNSPVVVELRRLWDAGLKVSPTLLGDKSGYDALTPEQNTELWKKSGTILDEKLGKLFQTKQYQSLADEEKAKLIEDFVDKSKSIARVQSVIEVTQGLSGDELNKKLSALKASGLMTKEVFNLWLTAQ